MPDTATFFPPVVVLCFFVSYIIGVILTFASLPTTAEKVVIGGIIAVMFPFAIFIGAATVLWLCGFVLLAIGLVLKEILLAVMPARVTGLKLPPWFSRAAMITIGVVTTLACVLVAASEISAYSGLEGGVPSYVLWGTPAAFGVAFLLGSQSEFEVLDYGQAKFIGAAAAFLASGIMLAHLGAVHPGYVAVAFGVWLFIYARVRNSYKRARKSRS